MDVILQSGHLFAENPLLPVSPLFPGLHLATVSLAQVLEVDSYSAGVILLALLRVAFMIAIFILFEYTTRSARAAGLASLLYMGNSNFIFFSSQFAYESVALPVSGLLICVVVRRGEFDGMRRMLLNLLVILLVIVVVATHHVTSYVIILFLLLTLVIFLAFPLVERMINRVACVVTRLALYRHVIAHMIPADDGSPVAQEPLARQIYAWTGLLTAVFAAAWLVWVATPTLGYLSPVFEAAFKELVSIIQREGQSRVLFSSAAGGIRPLWERLTSIGAVLLTIAVFPYGALVVWRKYRQHMIALSLTIAAASYFVTLGLRFTESGWEIANRSADYLFLGVGLVTALGMLSLFRRHQAALWRNLLLAFVATVIFVGGFQAGWPTWARVPGPYMVGADTRSIEPEGLAAAAWTAQHLAPNSRLVADRINGLLMGAYGRQYIIRSGTDGVQIAPVLFSLYLRVYEYDLLRSTRSQYVVTDLRLTQALPELGMYVEAGEPGSTTRSTPLSPLALEKFDLLPGVSRIYDEGNIVIYDVRRLTNATP